LSRIVSRQAKYRIIKMLAAVPGAMAPEERQRRDAGEFVDKRIVNHSQEQGHKGDPSIHRASCAWKTRSQSEE
jgi:hypothetical protein